MRTLFSCGSILLGLSLTTAAFAEQKVPILDIFPRCEYPIVKQFELAERVVTNNVRRLSDRETLVTALIEEARKKSAKLKADAIIIHNIETDFFEAGSALKRKTEAYKIRVKLFADAIKLCEEDRTLDQQLTPYNQYGHKNVSAMGKSDGTLDTQFEMKLVKQVAAPIIKLDPAISLKNGFHGVKPGMTLDEVMAVWGPADAEFLLQSQHYSAAAFGKRYWLTLYQGKVVAAETDHPLLSAEISHQLPDNTAFTHLSWALDGNIAPRTSFDQLNAAYPELHPVAENQFALVQPPYALQLGFQTYQNLQTGEAEPTLHRLQLKLATFAPEQQPVLKIALAEPPQLTEASQAFTLQFWQDLLQELPQYNRLNMENGEHMTIVNPTVAALYRDQQLTEIQLLPMYKGQHINELYTTLTALDMPQSKSGFLQRFPDAFDSLGKLIYYGTELEVKALYAEDGSIQSLTIRFM